MKTLKKALLLAASLGMMISAMAISASAANPSTGTADAGKTLKSATVTNSGVSFNGQEQTANVVVKDANGNTVPAEYLEFSGHKQTNSGVYTVTVKAKAPYTGSLTTTFEIKATPQKADKKATIKAKKTAVKAKKGKKTTVKVVTTSKKNKNASKKGVVKIKVVKGPKGKKGKGGITFNGKKIIFPKGVKKGTYVFKVTIPAYNKIKATSKKIKIRII